MTEFFYRIDHLGLHPGNKTAGFVALVSTEMLMALRAIPVSKASYDNLIQEMQDRLARTSLLTPKSIASCGVALLDNSACPRFFTADPMFGGSIGANPEDLLKLTRPDAVEWLGSSLAYTPHNVDLPDQALALVILFQTWAEWAREQCELAEFKARQAKTA